jgi:hypothetical protein
VRLICVRTGVCLFIGPKWSTIRAGKWTRQLARVEPNDVEWRVAAERRVSESVLENTRRKNLTRAIWLCNRNPSPVNLCLQMLLFAIGGFVHRAQCLSSAVQYDSAEWKPREWKPSWNLPQFLSEKWKLSCLGPCGLASVSYLSS